MSTFSPGVVPAPSVTLSTRDGSTSRITRDSDGVIIESLDSKGNLKIRGRVGKL